MVQTIRGWDHNAEFAFEQHFRPLRAYSADKEPARMFEDLNDEDLLIVWERTRRVLSPPADGTVDPIYPDGQYRWYLAAEAELRRRGYVENPPGIWLRPDRFGGRHIGGSASVRGW